MFSTLHELAKQATLMITVAAEGDDQLRVNVTPMPFDTKAKSKLPQPLSLLATPTEFDADFIAALSTWQAPKRTLIQQAQDAAGGAPAAAAPALPAPKAEAKGDGKTEKPRKARAGKGGDDDKKDGAPVAGAAGDQAPAGDQPVADSAGAAPGEPPLDGADAATTAADTGGEVVTDQDVEQAGGAEATTAQPESAAAAVDQVAAGAGAAPEAPAGDEPVDKFTLDLF